MLVNHLLKPKVLILLTAIFCIGIILGIFIPMLIGGGGSSASVGDRLILTGNPQNAGLNIPLTTVDATTAGWIDPILCAPGRGRYFTKDDSSNLIVLYNNYENVAGVYIRSDVEMPEPWEKIDSLKGGGGIELIDKEHWGLYTFFSDPIEACQRSDSDTVGTGGTGYSGGHAVRDYQPTPTPTVTLGATEIITQISTALSSDSRTFAVTNPADQSNITTGIKSSQIAELLSSLTNTQEGTSQWIDNISHIGLTGDAEAANITTILTSAKSDNLKVSLWINDDNQINLIEITASITHDGKEFSKLTLSPE